MAVSDLERLYQLQECELRLVQLERIRQSSPEAQLVRELKERAEKFEKLQQMLQKRLAAARKRVRTLELELGATQQSHRSVQERLYGGEVSNAKELAQLEARLNELQAKVEEDELALLEAMEQLEVLEEQKGKVDAGEAKTARLLEAAQAKLEHKRSSWDIDEAMLLGEAEELRSQVDPANLKLYERKKSTTDGTPIAIVRQGVCGGCRMTLPVSVATLRGRPAATCEQCGRLLLWPE